MCSKFWYGTQYFLADFDFERELKNTYGQVYNEEKAKIQKRFVFYEDIVFEFNKLPQPEEESDDEEEKADVDQDIIEYDEDTAMGQMQKMFQWNRGQQEWAQRVLNDKGRKHKKSKKFNDPFKHLGWSSHFKKGSSEA